MRRMFLNLYFFLFMGCCAYLWALFQIRAYFKAPKHEPSPTYGEDEVFEPYLIPPKRDSQSLPIFVNLTLRRLVMSNIEQRFKIHDHIEDSCKTLSGIIKEIDFQRRNYIISIDEQDTRREIIPWEYAQAFGVANEPIWLSQFSEVKHEPRPIGYSVLICDKDADPYEVS